MKNSKIAINGFFGRMGQAIYELSLEQKFNVTLGVDKKDKLQSDLNLELSDNLTVGHPLAETALHTNEKGSNSPLPSNSLKSFVNKVPQPNPIWTF